MGTAAGARGPLETPKWPREILAQCSGWAYMENVLDSPITVQNDSFGAIKGMFNQ
jgi:hypothetical protein